MKFDNAVCSDLSVAYRKEWLETNGLGGFASSTIIGINTRRYHGLLVAALRPPVGRMVLLSKFEEILWIGDRCYEFSSNQYPGVIHPKGYLWQTEFRLDPLPIFRYRIADIILEKTIFMLRGQHSTALSYEVLEGPDDNIALEVRPLIAFRDYHSLMRENPFINREVLEGEGWTAVRPYSDLPALLFNHAGANALSWAHWFHNFEYEEERQRGLDWREDLFCPFALRFDLSRGAAQIIVSTEVCDASRLEEFKSAEIERRTALLQGWEQADDLVQHLVVAADQFIVPRDQNRTVLAGYHWFTDWGRDAMISLPGLTLTPGRYEDAKRILLAFAQHCRHGLLPNRFPDAGEEPEYNTVDATLWFLQAIYALVQHTGDYTFVHGRLYEQILNIIRWHIDGTRFNIKVDGDGLLRSGEPGVQLTWMDVKIGGEVITPRIGKPVEVQALWYNALRIVEELARYLGDKKTEELHGRLAARARRSFNQQFWNAETRCLYDCIDGELRDASIRPNQILAASLPFTMLSKERMKAVLEVVTQKLLTPFGLRSLSPDDPNYHGSYGSDTLSRERAYHEGTVWAWLMGPYITASIRAAGGTRRAREAAAVLLNGFRRHLSDAGLGFVSEIFDGDPPHAPRGCIAQAWSVAELLRVAVDDLKLGGK